MGIEGDAQKVSNITFSLKDIVLVSSHHRRDDNKKGSNPINIWDELKKELKKQFY